MQAASLQMSCSHTHKPINPLRGSHACSLGCSLPGCCAPCHCSPEESPARFLLQECGSPSAPSRHSSFGMRHLPQTALSAQGSLSNGLGHGGEALPAHTTPRGLPLGGPPPLLWDAACRGQVLMDATARERLLREELLCSQLSRNESTVRKISSECSLWLRVGRFAAIGVWLCTPPVSAVCLGDGGRWCHTAGVPQMRAEPQPCPVLLSWEATSFSDTLAFSKGGPVFSGHNRITCGWKKKTEDGKKPLRSSPTINQQCQGRH